ncbi:MAG: ABC transporter permease [Aggregatilineales bacterium]
MSATVAKPTTTDISLSPAHFIGIVIAVLLMIAYVGLPFIDQPELGATTVYTLTAGRGNNELEVETNGLVLIPIAAIAMIAFSVWNILQPKMGRAVAVFIAFSGVMALLYYAVFFKGYIEEDATYINAMGIAFWAMLFLSALAVLQILIPRARTSERRYQIQKVLGNQESVLLFGLLVLIIAVGLSNPRFLSERNITALLQGNAYIAIAALGMSMVIITGNIDISVGSLIGLLAVISGVLVVDNGMPVWIAWLVPLILGAFFGAINGFLVAYLNIPSIVVTLGGLSIIKGVLIIWREGERVTDLPDSFFLAQQRPLGIPMPIYLMIILTVLVAFWLRYSATGRSLYALGGNAEAARLSGLSQRGIVMQAFVLNGVFAGIASVVYATQLTIIQATPPPSLELFIITASVVGGVSILGGTGTVIGATIAAIFLNAIQTSLVFVSISQFWAQAIQGTLILATVLADLLRRQRQRL